MAITDAPAPARRDPGPILWLVTGVAWLATIALMLVPWGMPGMPSMAAAGLGVGTTAGLSWTLAAFAVGWVVMVVAMMLPTTLPMARMFLVVTSDVPARRRVLTAFSGAYVVVWLAAGALGLVAAALVARASAGLPPGAVLAGALALAGAFQFSPLKQRCLTLCRDPRSFLFTRYRRGTAAAWSLGVRHAMACLGCCWALMAVMFAVGSGGLLWMLGLTAVMVAEKTAPWGRRLVVPIGVALLAAAVVVGAVTLLGPTPLPLPLPTHHM